MLDTTDCRELAISVSGVKKQYRLGQINGGTLQEDLQSWWARKRGKEDPNLRIGFDQRLVGQTFMALNGVDLTVYRGEALGIIGANGAGKSTLLKLISRITAPTEGDIDLYGRVSSMLEVGTGFNGQMTGRENIYMNGAILGMSRAEIDAKMEDIIEFSEVRDFIDTPVKRYSSGMFVKLAFAVAAHLNSEIMIMDEVLAVGDVAFQKKCLKRMREVATLQGRTVLYVSHNMNTIRELCSRCVVMDQGKIIYDGEVDRAIALYMDRSTGESETDIDLNAKGHTANGIDFGVRMNRLLLEDRAGATYDNAETLRMRIYMDVRRPLSGVHFRLTLRTDTDQPLGTAYSEPMELSEPGQRELLCSFPLSAVAKGTLYCSIGLFRRDELGRMCLLDQVERAFRIVVEPKLEGLFWYPSVHGYFRLPPIETELLLS